ncbi:MAG TPA: DoxX family protein [Vulgatibacter sp.]|nr:DoxX family protein [Vulgatibacter sp.]
MKKPSSETLARFRVVAHGLLRIVPALLMMQHGAQKLFGALGGAGGSGEAVPLFSLLGLAGILEFFVAALVVIGLFTRPAALLLAVEMAVAYLMAHAPMGFWPISNGGEPALLLLFVFLYLATAGPGPWSLDARREASRKRL